MSAALALPSSLPAEAPSSDLTHKGRWLVSPRYDLAFIIFSSVLIVFPHATYMAVGKNILVDLTVTLLIGGPHLFATYTMTFMEPRFRQRYPRYVWGALALPPLIVTLAIVNLTLLVTIFFFWASVHVIHQVAYVSDAYRMKDPRGWTWKERIIDYGLLMTALYPVATGKLIRSEFVTGGRKLLFPNFLKMDWVPLAVWAVFLFFLGAFIVKTVREWREDRLNVGKTLLISLATVLFFVTPMMANLDVAFQGLNTWHSFQYLAVVLYLNRYRAQKGLIGSELVTRVSQRGWTLYAMCFGFTMLAAAMYFFTLSTVVRMEAFQTGGPLNMFFVGQIHSGQHFFSFYSVILSCLLIHYYFDHFVFLQKDKVITPNWA